MKLEKVVIYPPFGIYGNVFCMTPSILSGICVNSDSLSEKICRYTLAMCH